MMDKFNPDSFAPFLESIKSPQTNLLSRPSMLQIVQVLADSEDSEMDTGALASKSALPIDNLASDLKQLEAQQLVTRRLKNGREFVRLTEGGKNLLGV